MARLEFKAPGFSAAHFVVGHTKCEHLHGHNWEVKAVVEGEPDQRGLVVDFNELSEILGELCGRYDHRVLVPAKNPAVRIEPRGSQIVIRVHRREFVFPADDVAVVPVDNITVERMASHLLEELERRLVRHSNVKRVAVWVGEKPEEGAWAHSERVRF